jgi:protein arginine kinase activator
MKKCDLCGSNEAKLKVRQMEKDGKIREIEVCPDCARTKGFSEAEKIQTNAAGVLAEMRKNVAEEDAQLVCLRCKMTFAEFKRKGRLGCAACYESFRPKLEPLIRRMQGATQHVGKTAQAGRKPARDKMAVRKLREELQGAIAAEDYEKAAALRDRLGRAEKNADS